MMPTFPRSPLSFRTAGFPQYGWKAGFPSGAFLDHQQLKPAPGMRRPTSSLHPPFVRFVVSTVVPLCVGPPTRLRTAVARRDKGCERLMTVPGIGPIISSAMVAAIGTGDVFSKGRDFGAWLGLVPKQLSTGDRTILGSISKRGNRYLRSLFVEAAWVVLVKIAPKHWDRYGLKSWIEAARKRLHHNVLAIALANKLARIAWAVLNKGRAFECVKTEETASRPA